MAFYPHFTENRWKPNPWKPKDPIPKYNMYMFEGLEHKYRIPTTEFVENVQKFIDEPENKGDIDVTLRNQDEVLMNYKFMEINLIRRREIIRKQFRDNKESMKVLEYLEDKFKKEENVQVLFKATDLVYLKAQVPPTNKVYTYLGANIYPQYRIHRTWCLLWQNDKKLFKQLYKNDQDLGFIYDQITKTEVNISRIYNWNVNQRRNIKKRAIEMVEITELLQDMVQTTEMKLKTGAVREFSHLIEQMIFSIGIKPTIQEKSTVDEEVSILLEEIIDMVVAMPVIEKTMPGEVEQFPKSDEKLPTEEEKSVAMKVFHAVKKKFAVVRKVFALMKKTPLLEEEIMSKEDSVSSRVIPTREKKIDEFNIPEWDLAEVEKRTSEIEAIEPELKEIVHAIKTASYESLNSALLHETTAEKELSNAMRDLSIATKDLSTATKELSTATIDLPAATNQKLSATNELCTALNELSNMMKLFVEMKRKFSVLKTGLLSKQEPSQSETKFVTSFTISEIDLLTLPSKIDEQQ